MDILEQLHQAVIKGHPGEAEKLTANALDAGIEPLRLVEDAIMPAMRTVGERYKNEETDILRILAMGRISAALSALPESRPTEAFCFPLI